MIDLDELVPLPLPVGTVDISAHAHGLACAKPGLSYWNADMIRAVRLAAWNAALDVAIKAVEHEAFPSELPRFKVATDWLRDMRIEDPKPSEEEPMTITRAARLSPPMPLDFVPSDKQAFVKDHLDNYSSALEVWLSEQRWTPK